MKTEQIDIKTGRFPILISIKLILFTAVAIWKLEENWYYTLPLINVVIIVIIAKFGIIFYPLKRKFIFKNKAKQPATY